MSTIPPHIAITWQRKYVYEPGKRGVPSARPSTTISSDTCKPVTQPLSPAAQAVLDAFLGDAEDTGLQMDDLRENVAAALRAAVDHVVPAEDPPVDFLDTHLAAEIDQRRSTRSQFLAIAAELEDSRYGHCAHPPRRHPPQNKAPGSTPASRSILPAGSKPTNRGTTMSEPKELLMPPDELVQLWEEACNALTPSAFLWRQAMYLYCARWGADQELEACCKWLIAAGVPRLSEEMYAALNRKAPSLKEQALEALKTADIGYSLTLTPAEVSIVRRALEALPDE